MYYLQYAGGELSRFLQKVTILIADQDYCRKVYAPLKADVYETHICAHDPVSEHGSCQVCHCQYLITYQVLVK